MYRVSPEIPHVHGVLSKFSGLAVAARDDQRPTVMDAVRRRSPKLLARVAVGALFEGHEAELYERARNAASWYTGRQIIGCGADALVTRRDDEVIKFAPRPIGGRAVDAVRELRRRYDLACRYIGESVLATDFSPAVIDGRSTPSVVIMRQEFIEGAQDALAYRETDEVHLQLVGLQERAERLYREQGVIVDLRASAHNILLDSAGTVRLVDTVASHVREDGKRRLLSPHIANTRHDFGHIQHLLQPNQQ